MSAAIAILRWIVRLTGLAALLIGFALWSGTGYNLLGAHQGLGYVLSISLLLMAVFGFTQRLSPTLLTLALLLSLAVPGLGSMQTRLLPGAAHWVIEVLHLLLGLAAITLAERIGGQARARAKSSAA
ncbi:hypothetical protein HNR42_000014 [Deinobacterium chartae]|uniref:Uncharacterized protein n=1 Tax=Deinobacterium chartae TaxID=521158 RepID=A0A841HXB9_9DEIO|nr:hypothetical protein [Deinobacterium chartae]MBB6096602.1 hypothetical protein [Deinobacterium chartae]